MECMWVKALQVIRDIANFSHLKALVMPNEKVVEALVDRSCGWTSVHRAVGEPLDEVLLQIRCIHGDVRDYSK